MVLLFAVFSNDWNLQDRLSPVGRNYDLPFVQMVDEKGVMLVESPFGGMRCKPTASEIEAGAVSADPEVIKELSGRKLLYDKE